jgi:dihydroorotate dehydrogenase electron transfer subunit
MTPASPSGANHASTVRPGCHPPLSASDSVSARRLVHATVPVVENQLLARRTYRLRLECPELAAAIEPGQFLMLRFPDRLEPLLGRAFALLDVVRDSDERPWGVDIGYFVVGKTTRLLERLRPGDLLTIWGPLGQPFPSYHGVRELVLIAGGIGQTPFVALVRRVLGLSSYGSRPAGQECERVRLVYGTRSADLLTGVEEFARLGVVVHICTEDGTAGRSGRVTDVLSDLGKPSTGVQWVACGPHAMLKAVAELARQWQVPCQVTLETPMACGTGICYSCVTRVRVAQGWDYRRVCVEGPLFDAAQLVWEEN